MKKLALATFVAVVFPTFVFAQGTVNFSTTDFVNHRVLMPGDQSPAPAGTTVELWWSPDNVVGYSLIAVNTVTTNGWIGTPVVGTTGVATAGGATAWFYVRAVNGSLEGRTLNFQNATGVSPGAAANLTGWNSPLYLGLCDSPAFISRQPTNQFVAPGTNLTLTVVAYGCPPPSYQWWNSHGTIAGATNASYGINPVQTNHAGDYWVVVTNSWAIRTSAVATVTVLVPGSFTMQTSDDSFGLRTNRFGFNITGPSNLVVVVEASTNLANPGWSPVRTNTLTGGSSYFNDAQWTNYPTRFYRLRWP
jgi:hypothetical protein